MSRQAPHSILMIKPNGFGFNSETSISNVFQNKSEGSVEEKALNEFEIAVAKLLKNDIDIMVFENERLNAPDAVFPNNWFSTHDNGTVVLYPMLAENRRLERRMDIISYLQEKFDVTGLIDLTEYEDNGIFLEGTGSIIFDHDNGKAYAAESDRTNCQLFNSLCQQLGYQAHSFMAIDPNNHPIYHTNVMLSIASRFAIICSASIENIIERQMILNSLNSDNKEIIDLSFDQMNHFAANVLEVKNKKEELVLIMSSTSLKAIFPEQLKLIQETHQIIDIDIPTIEKIGGGSARCMMAGIHLTK